MVLHEIHKKVWVMYDRDGQKISWQFIEELAKLQDREELRSGLLKYIDQLEMINRMKQA